MTNYNKKEHLNLLKDLWNNPNLETKSIEKYSEMYSPFEVIPNVSVFRIKNSSTISPDS